MDNGTVYVVDDIEANRALIVMLMASVDLPTLSFASAQEFLDAYEPGQPGCLLLDMRMPGMSGLELQRQLTEKGVYIPIIFITAHNDSYIAVQAMKAGAFDFVEKPFNNQLVLDIVYNALAESSRIIAEHNELSAIKTLINSLTPREREVFEMIVDGQPNKVIAHLLSISERTVEVHRSHVMEKMETSSLATLIKMAMRCDIGKSP